MGNVQDGSPAAALAIGIAGVVDPVVPQGVLKQLATLLANA
jgi:hypothetical protein